MIVLAIFIAFLWGVSPVVHKFALSAGYSQYTLMVVGAVFYNICLALFAATKWNIIYPEIRSMSWKIVGLLATTSIFTGFMASLLYYRVLKQHSRSYIATTIMYCSPIFTLILAALFLKEKVNAVSLGGVLVTVLGVCMLAYETKNEEFHTLI